MNEIKLFIGKNEVKLTKEDIEELNNKYQPYIKHPLFRRIHNDTYFYISYDGFVEKSVDLHHNEDDMRYDVANYCKEKNIMVDRAKTEALNRLLWQFSLENGWSDDLWEDKYSYKYFILYNRYEGKWDIRSVQTYEIPGLVYFASGAAAREALNEIIIPFRKGGLEICQIWDDYDDGK